MPLDSTVFLVQILFFQAKLKWFLFSKKSTKSRMLVILSDVSEGANFEICFYCKLFAKIMFNFCVNYRSENYLSMSERTVPSLWKHYDWSRNQFRFLHWNPQVPKTSKTVKSSDLFDSGTHLLPKRPNGFNPSTCQSIDFLTYGSSLR